jgi:hypothetical protein
MPLHDELRQSPRRRERFNPFIVLSDVTISTIVLLACLLMIFAASLGVAGNPYEQNAKLRGENRSLRGRITQLEARLDTQAKAIKDEQDSLLARTEKELPAGIWVDHARGLQTFVIRFANPGMFDRAAPGQLSPDGRRLFASWGRSTGPLLSDLAGAPVPVQDCVELFEQAVGSTGNRIDPSRNREPFSLVEVQVQGHCSRETRDPWDISVRRATEVAAVLRTVPGFPVYLLSVSGYSWHRRVYQTYKEHHPPLDNRIDIRCVFSGDSNDSTFANPYVVDPSSGRSLLYGIPSVTSLPVYAPWEKSKKPTP